MGDPLTPDWAEEIRAIEAPAVAAAEGGTPVPPPAAVDQPGDAAAEVGQSEPAAAQSDAGKVDEVDEADEDSSTGIPPLPANLPDDHDPLFNPGEEFHAQHAGRYYVLAGNAFTAVPSEAAEFIAQAHYARGLRVLRHGSIISDVVEEARQTNGRFLARNARA